MFTGKGLTVVATVLEGDYLQTANDVLQSQKVSHNSDVHFWHKHEC